MFIRLTRLDGQPIWINAGFVVTVEPRRQGGATVVPVGDGLDYDVREAPERVLEMLAGAPEPAVVPIPTTDALTVTPADVSPDGTDAATLREAVTGQESAATEPPPPAAAEEVPAETPAKRTRTTRKAAGTTKTTRTRRTAKKSAPPDPDTLTDEQVERIRKMAPRSIRKLTNSLTSQLRVPDPEAAVRELERRGVLAIEQDHVNWNVGK